jgi:hypothetical protein
MLSRKYAEWIIGPELTPEFAARVINGEVLGGHIWYDVCTFAGGWCNDANVFLAWDAMGRPSEREYMDPDYYSVRSPERRRAVIANARISAMAECVADALYSVVNEIIVNEGWKCIPATEIETDMHGIGWLEKGCGALDCNVESYLFKPDGK